MAHAIAPEPIDVDADRDPGLARAFEAFLRFVARYWFRFRVRGVENVPAQPALFVGNHSGIGIADVICLLGSRTEIAPHRRAVGLMHDLFVNMPIVGRLSRAAGAVSAHPAHARQALARGYHVAVFPGGNLDACRPITEARRVVFGKRRGYVRLALETGAPVVPIATLGSHPTYVLLPWIGDAIGPWFRRLGLSRDERTPVPLASLLVLDAVVGVALGVFPWWTILVALVVLLVPNPCRIESVILEPIDLRAATAHVEDPEERIELANDIVLRRLQAVVARGRGADAQGSGAKRKSVPQR
jgi:1-acyl-sn-glycerol-3-phosphate acyltransferase